MTTPQPTAGQRALFIATILSLALLSAMLAIVGGFYTPDVRHVLGVPVPIGVLIAIGGNLIVGVAGARGAGSRIAPAVSGFVWLVIAFILGSRRSEGDLVVTGQAPGVAFLLLGAAAAAAAIGIGPARRTGRWRALHPWAGRADDAGNGRDVRSPEEGPVP